jgi:hypothetical protein
MSKSILFISFLAIMAVGSWSCNKDNDDDNGNGCSTAWATELSNQITAMSNAAQAYALDPSYENCLAYKAAAQAYVDALAPYGNCAALIGQSRIAWQQALDDAQQGVDDIDCQP